MKTEKRKSKTSHGRTGRRQGIYARSRLEVFGRFVRPDRSVMRMQTPFTVDVGPSIDGDEWPIKNNGRNLSITRCAHRGMTQMRFAFESLPASGSRGPLGHRILRTLLKRGRSAPGKFNAGGWRVLRDDKARLLKKATANMRRANFLLDEISERLNKRRTKRVRTK